MSPKTHSFFLPPEGHFSFISKLEYLITRCMQLRPLLTPCFTRFGDCDVPGLFEETRTHPIEVIPQYKIKVGVTHWNDGCRPLDIIKFCIQSLGFRSCEFFLECVFNSSQPLIKLPESLPDKQFDRRGAKPKAGKTIASAATRKAIVLCT